MCRVNSDESVPDAPEYIQLKLSLYAQHKAVLLQLRIKGRLVKPVLVECKLTVFRGRLLAESRSQKGRRPLFRFPCQIFILRKIKRSRTTLCEKNKHKTHVPVPEQNKQKSTCR
jgi:hypothetical protein